jgi:tripartite-type tricarboxylate transporter receptor subunit TctC
VLVVNADFPAQNLQEFIQYAKQNPDKLTYGSGNTGSLAAAQLIKSMTGIEARNVPYKGTPAAITDLLAGRIDFIVTDVAVTREFVETKKLKALGVTTATRVPTLPEVPTMAEAGIPGYQFAAWSGLFAPAGTPPEIVQKLNSAFLEALKGPEADKFFNLVALEPDPSTADELHKHVQTQTELWGRIIAETGLKKS